MKLVVDKQLVTLAELRMAWNGSFEVSLGIDARRAIAESAEYISDVVESGAEIYGVNTGFGQLARVHISDDELVKLQRISCARTRWGSVRISTTTSCA